MEIRIGIVQSMKEIELDLGPDVDEAAITTQIETSLTNDTMLWLTDRKGRRVGVPAARVAYIDIGAPGGERKVGFGAQA